MDMSHMHTAGIGTDLNYAFARDYWYIAAGVVGLFTVVRAVNHYGVIQRRKACSDPSVKHSTCTRPNGRLSQAWATATAVVRELGHPQLFFNLRGFHWATPPNLGRVVLLLIYWAVVIYFMSSDAVHYDAYFWERIGYRNAWVTLAQLPMLFLLAMKCNPIGWLIGSGHERLNWLHRWVARTMFVTATVHGFHFWTQWVLADFVAYELAIMPLVRYGLGAWAVLLWSVVVGFVPIRRMAYEVWLIQHIVSAAVMLWLLYKHIPANAQYLLFMAISFLVFDRLARWFLLLWSNTFWSKGVGYDMSMRTEGDSTTLATIHHVRFRWQPGQFIYLWVPRLGPLEAHPYTIASAREASDSDGSKEIQLLIRAHSGFSKRIHKHTAAHPDKTLKAFIMGPFGNPPSWDAYETLVLISASTGASFNIPILESIGASKRKTCVRRIDMAIIAKTCEEISFYTRRAKDASRLARDKGIDVRLHIATTAECPKRDDGVDLVQASYRDDSDLEKGDAHGMGKESEAEDPCRRRSASSTSVRSNGPLTGSLGGSFGVTFKEYTTRPDIEAIIREPIEQAWGEAAVVVCAGRELVARTRNCVSRLSDERAVHKGTGAQGIYLHVEEYAF
ncbi:hypothetical protein HIM_04214 [Hirsutella minnesotensis 3608]|uniref:ferric-chelate reductase (NADPH) n=1 Tax=Hirsutella minnesotensis 3608 TaxID=1043627 RepID=A0A0F7ZQ20_9HYPO|nr:hypothetical protein HIM_04214 [Hirsutella minnesotensis 3608]